MITTKAGVGQWSSALHQGGFSQNKSTSSWCDLF